MNQAQWPAPVCAVFVLLFYLSQTPLTAAVAVHSGGVGVGVGVWAWKGALKRAARHALRSAPGKRPRLRLTARDKARILRFAARHGSLELLRVTGVIALSDAQKTCLAVGAVRGLCAALGERGEARVQPAFAGESAVEAQAVVSMRLTHVLGAVIMALAAHFAHKERMKRHGKVSH